MFSGVAHFISNLTTNGYSVSNERKELPSKSRKIEKTKQMSTSTIEHELLMAMRQLVPCDTQPLSSTALANNQYSIPELVSRKSLHRHVNSLVEQYLIIEMLMRCGINPQTTGDVSFLTAYQMLAEFTLQYHKQNAELESMLNEKKRRIAELQAQKEALLLRKAEQAQTAITDAGVLSLFPVDTQKPQKFIALPNNICNKRHMSRRSYVVEWCLAADV